MNANIHYVDLVDAGLYGLARQGMEGTAQASAKIAASIPSDQEAIVLASRVVEDAMRQWLERTLPLDDRRGLLFLAEDRVTHAYDLRLRELDAVWSQGGRPKCLFEIGLTSNLANGADKRHQLRTSLEIARRRWRDVGGCVILINCGPPQNGCRTADLVTTNFSLNVCALGRIISQRELGFVVIPVEDFWADANRQGLGLCDDLLSRLIRIGKRNASLRAEATRDRFIRRIGTRTSASHGLVATAC